MRRHHRRRAGHERLSGHRPPPRTRRSSPPSRAPNPVSLLAWIFNPIFQGLFILLVWVDSITGDIGLAIIVMTLVVRTALIPLFRRQIVSTKRTQMIQPELKELQKRYKGDRARSARPRWSSTRSAG